MTHGVSFLRAVDQIVHIHGEQPNCSSQSENVATTTFILEGQIVGTGTFDELMATDEKFADTIAEAQRVQEESASDEEQAGDDAASANEQIEDVELALRDEADAEEFIDEHLPLAVGADEVAVESVAEMSAAPSPVKRALTAVSDLADDSPKSPRRRRPHRSVDATSLHSKSSSTRSPIKPKPIADDGAREKLIQEEAIFSGRVGKAAEARANAPRSTWCEIAARASRTQWRLASKKPKARIYSKI